MIINFCNLESTLMQKSTQVVIPKTLEADVNSIVRTPAIICDDTDLQVNQIIVTLAASVSTTY